MFVVDTNVLLYAANQDAPEYEVCNALLESWRAGEEPWCVTWSVVYEFLSVTTDARVPRPLTAAQAWSFLEGLLAAPSLSVVNHTSSHATALAGLLGDVPTLSGRVFHDAHIAALTREHGIRTIYTRDRSFRRFPFLEVIDPLSA